MLGVSLRCSLVLYVLHSYGNATSVCDEDGTGGASVGVASDMAVPVAPSQSTDILTVPVFPLPCTLPVGTRSVQAVPINVNSVDTRAEEQDLYTAPVGTGISLSGWCEVTSAGSDEASPTPQGNDYDEDIEDDLNAIYDAVNEEMEANVEDASDCSDYDPHRSSASEADSDVDEPADESVLPHAEAPPVAAGSR